MDKEQYINELLERDKQSSSRIVAQNLKDRFTYPYLPTMVVDNFYEEPDQVRDYALSLEYFKGDRGSWPGVRTKLFHEFDQVGNKHMEYVQDRGTFVDVPMDDIIETFTALYPPAYINNSSGDLYAEADAELNS